MENQDLIMLQDYCQAYLSLTYFIYIVEHNLYDSYFLTESIEYPVSPTPKSTYLTQQDINFYVKKYTNFLNIS